MSMMAQTKRFSEKGIATVACLITLALLAGPICASTCSGTECLARFPASDPSSNCHGMTGHGDCHFNVRSIARPCNVANGSLAVLGRLVVGEFPRAAHNGKFDLAAASASAAGHANAFPMLHDLSTGPPLTFLSVTSPAILRI